MSDETNGIAFSSDDIECSICHKNYLTCEHQAGETYVVDGVEMSAIAIINNATIHSISFHSGKGTGYIVDPKDDKS